MHTGQGIYKELRLHINKSTVGASSLTDQLTTMCLLQATFILLGFDHYFNNPTKHSTYQKSFNMTNKIWLIGVEHHFQLLFSYTRVASTPYHLCPGFLAPVLYTILFKQASFSPLAEEKDAMTSVHHLKESMVEPGFELGFENL